MNKKILYIPIEVTPRELHSRLLLAYEAIKKGFLVFIGSFAVVNEALKIKDGVLIDKSISKTKYELFKTLRESNIRFCSIDEEGLGIQNNQAMFLNFRYPKSTVELAEKVFCWGEFDYRKLTGLHAEFRDKFVKVGNPRVDLCSEQYQSYLGLIPFNHSHLENYVLITSNHSVNNANGFDFINKQSEIYNVFKDRQDEEEHEIKRRYRFLTFLNCSIAYEKIISENPKTTFVFRPHPSENVDFWKAFLHHCKNCEVIYDHNYLQWLANAKLVIHSSCTTGVFSHFLKIPTIAYLPYPKDPYAKFIPNKLSFIANDIQEFEKIVAKCLSKKRGVKELSDEDNTALKHFIFSHPAKSSAQLIVDAIEQGVEWSPTQNHEIISTYKDLKSQINKNPFTTYPILRLYSQFIRRTARKMSTLLVSKNKKEWIQYFPYDAKLKYSNEYAKQQFEHITKDKIIEMLKTLNEIHGRISFGLIEVSNNVFLLSKR